MTNISSSLNKTKEKKELIASVVPKFSKNANESKK